MGPVAVMVGVTKDATGTNAPIISSPYTCIVPPVDVALNGYILKYKVVFVTQYEVQLARVVPEVLVAQEPAVGEWSTPSSIQVTPSVLYARRAAEGPVPDLLRPAVKPVDLIV